MPGQFIDTPGPKFIDAPAPVAAAGAAPKTGQFIDAPAPKLNPANPPMKQATAAISKPINQAFGQAMKVGGSALGEVGMVLGTPERAVSGMIGGTHEGGPMEGIKSAVGDAFHPNDEAAIQHHQDEGEAALSGGHAKDVTNKYAKGAMDFGYQTAIDPMTYAGGAIMKGAVKGAGFLGKLVPGAEEAFNAVRTPFVGSRHLDDAGMTAEQKLRYKGIESSEHGRYMANVKDFNSGISKHLSDKNPAAVPDIAEPGIHEIAPGKQAVATQRTISPPAGVKVPQSAHQHGQMMFSNPAYRATYNHAIKTGMNDVAAKKAATDTVESMTADGPKAPEISPQDAPKESGGHILPENSQTGAGEAAIPQQPQRIAGESDAKFADRQFRHLYNTDETFKNAFQKAAGQGKTQQQAAMEAGRAMYHKFRMQATSDRATGMEGLHIGKTQADKAAAGFKAGAADPFAKTSRAIGNAQKAGMFINPIPHILGNVAQNSYLATGFKGLAKAANYTRDGSKIPKQTLDRMEQYGASHSDFDPFESIDKSGGDSPFVEAAKSFGNKATKLGSDIQNAKIPGIGHSTNDALNASETGARAAAFEHFSEEAAKKHGISVDELQPEHLFDVAQKTRTAIGDYRNKSKFVKGLEDRLGSQFPQYRGIAIGNTARAAVNNPGRLNNIYRAQDDANKDVIQDPQHEYTLGGIANAGNKAFSRPSDYARGSSGVGPLGAAILNIGGVQNANIAGTVPGGAGYGSPKSSTEDRIGKQALGMASEVLPAGANFLYDALVKGKGVDAQSVKDALIDLTGVQKGTKMNAKDNQRINFWEKKGGNINDPRLVPRVSNE
jgi:hypothetical protein